MPTSTGYRIVVSLLYVGRHPSGQKDRERERERALHLRILLAALTVIFLSQSIAAAQTKEVRRILVLNEVGPSYPSIFIVNQGIESALSNSPYHIDFYSEYFETALFPDSAAQQEFRDFYLRKYKDRKPDVIITVGPSPLKFMEEVHKRAFPGVPIVFCLPISIVPGSPALDSDFTGVENDQAPAETLAIALRLYPGTEHVVVVNGGISDYDNAQLAGVKHDLKGFADHLDITYLTNLALPDLFERLRHLPRHAVVLLTSISQDAAGTVFKSSDTGPMVAAAANAPVFSLFDVYINHGEVGGYLSSISEQGRIAGSMALRMLKGEKPRDIPRVKGVSTYMFDWRALKRWGLKESAVPPGSIVLNRQATMWETHKWYAIGGIALILLEALLIFGLVWQRERARVAETGLKRSEEHNREVVLRSPLAMVVTRGPDHKNELVNHKFTELFGYTIEDLPDEASWWPLAYPDKAYREAIKAEWERRVERALVEQKDIEPMEASVRCKDGSYRHIEFHFASFGDSTLVKFVDLTDRRLAEVQLRESEERFRLVANTAPVMIWMSGPDKLCNYFNQPWLDFTGRPISAELGNGWAEVVHPEDFQRCLDTYNAAFDRHERFEMEYRLRRHDGEYRWLFDTGVPRFGSEGSFIGYIGSCIDVTDRKLAEKAMSELGRKLIEAHEEERTWIGRELHDDINQRLALAVIELQQWIQEHPKSNVDIREHIGHVKQRLFDLGKDVQALSHRLHSSKLDYLGLAVAASSFCRESSEQQKVEIDFSHEGVPKNLPKEISLCLFRILQEALQNAVKYSGVQHFKVKLEGAPTDIHLTISDHGAGFDVQNALRGRGLGLVSMRERIQLVKGELSITSQPGHGTTVFARVPFSAYEHRISLAG